MSKDAEDLAFKTGYLIACCNLVNMHDQPEIACDVLAEAGITRDDVKAMDLCEYDAGALKKIRKSRPSNGDPIARPRKRRAALSAPSTEKGRG